MISYLSPYLWEKVDLWEDLATFDLAIDTFLSASQFGDYTSKLRMVRLAEEVAAVSWNPLHALRVACRQHKLMALFPSKLAYHFQVSLPAIEKLPPAEGKSDNALLGEIMLIRAQELIDMGAPSNQVLEAVQSIRAMDPNNVSTRERRVILASQILCARSQHFDGKFKVAAEGFREACAVAKEEKQLAQNWTAWHCNALSEADRHGEAIALATQDLQELLDSQPLQWANARVLQLALSNASLLQALSEMWSCKDFPDILASHRYPSLESATKGFLKLNEIYEKMKSPSVTITKRVFSVQCGLAIASQCRGNLSEAMEWWTKARETALVCWKEKGYAFMITTYSQSLVAFDLHSPDAEELYDEAQRSWDTLGHCRQYYFPGLGTVWFDLLGFWGEAKMGRRFV